MKLTNLSVFILSLFALAVLSGCTSMTQEELFNYKPKTLDMKIDRPIADSIFIAELSDKREAYEKITTDLNSDIWIMIPLWPYSKQELNPLMRYNYLQTSVKNKFQELITEDLRSSCLFKDIISADQNNPDLTAPDDAYRLHITLNHVLWNRYLTTYGLSYPGSFLWILALPVSYGSVVIDAEIVMKDRVSDKEIARKTIHKEIACTELIYDQVDYNPPKSATRLAELFPEFTLELRKFIVETIQKTQNKK